MWLRTIQQKMIVLTPPSYLIQRNTVSSDLSKFKQSLKAAKEVVFLYGAGISAESGVPIFKGKNFWRDFPSPLLNSPSAFRDDPGLVWEYYHYLRELVLQVTPNAGHTAITQYEAIHAEDKKVTVITQNIDGLHTKAGTKNVIELHGSMFKTRCTKCSEVLVNFDSPICEALRGQGSPTLDKLSSDIPEKDLPRCKKCGSLLRPHVLWFGEKLDQAIVDQLDPIISKCQMVLLIGTSSLVYPAAAYPTVMAAGGVTVAEFNIEPQPASQMFDFYFKGPSATTIPVALSE